MYVLLFQLRRSRVGRRSCGGKLCKRPSRCSFSPCLLFNRLRKFFSLLLGEIKRRRKKKRIAEPVSRKWKVVAAINLKRPATLPLEAVSVSVSISRVPKYDRCRAGNCERRYTFSVILRAAIVDWYISKFLIVKLLTWTKQWTRYYNVSISST